MENIDSQEIELYVRNKMSFEEKQKFEAKVEADPVLRKEVEESLLIAKGIRYAAQNDLRQRAINAHNSYHRNAWFRKPGSLILLVGGILIFAGFLWLCYLFFGNSKVTESDKKIDIKPNPVMASQSEKNKDDNLSMIGNEPAFSKSLPILNSEGKSVGEFIQVNIFRDQTVDQTNYLYQDSILNIFIPDGTNLQLPSNLIKQDNNFFIILNNIKYPLLKNGVLNPLKEN